MLSFCFLVTWLVSCACSSFLQEALWLPMEPTAENSSSEANPFTRLLPIYPAGAAFQGTPGDSNQIKSLSALQASHLYSPCSEETLQGPDSEANGMTKQGLCLLQFRLRSGVPKAWTTRGAYAYRVQVWIGSGTRSSKVFPLLSLPSDCKLEKSQKVALVGREMSP